MFYLQLYGKNDYIFLMILSTHFIYGVSASTYSFWIQLNSVWDDEMLF